MFEELLVAGENVLATSHEKIKVLAAANLDFVFCEAGIEALLTAARKNDIVGIIEGLRRLVPEYAPAYHFIGEAPGVFRRMRPDVYPETER